MRGNSAVERPVSADSKNMCVEIPLDRASNGGVGPLSREDEMNEHRRPVSVAD
jgi:hypothetical protein